MNKKVSLALCQIHIKEEKSKNLKKAERMISAAAGNGADIIILPEMFNCPYQNSFFRKFSENYPGETTDMLSDLSKQFSVYIIGGSIPEKEESRIYNTSFSFDRKGSLIGKHRKAHLFDVEIEGGIKFKESEIISAGDHVTVFETEFCRVGVAICYDMRFPEMFRSMSENGAKIIVVPAAFNMTTGPAHWHLTARARALDNQVYFVVVSPARDIHSSYVAYGHSLVANPWGKIIAEAKTSEKILYVNIDLDYVDKIRNQLPLLKHLRKDLYYSISLT
ncbi:MAG: carbon-nitrogen hydrolase family protein [Actinobacteria bacterium]|nr:carbon-nitrogen hydrolase family protein [Actinomycetota bacterium]